MRSLRSRMMGTRASGVTHRPSYIFVPIRSSGLSVSSPIRLNVTCAHACAGCCHTPGHHKFRNQDRTVRAHVRVHVHRCRQNRRPRFRWLAATLPPRPARVEVMSATHSSHVNHERQRSRVNGNRPRPPRSAVRRLVPPPPP